MKTALHHLALTVNSLDISRPWYDALLGAIGYKPGTVADSICTWHGQVPEILVYPAEGEDRTPHTHGRPGWQHPAFLVESREVVNAAFVAVNAVGGAVVHEPQEFNYMPGYYATFVTDPDGVRWEIFHAPGLAD